MKSRLNSDEIRAQAHGRWRSILLHLAIDVPPTPKKHGPCPACGGKDRFRFDDKDGRGTWFCNQCRPQAGDGFALMRSVKGCHADTASSVH
jgi:putative DNA primase/helicase